MLRGIGDRDPGEVGELVDAALPLGEELEELQPGRARERRADAGERLEDGALGVGVDMGLEAGLVFKHSIEYYIT